MVRLFTPPGLCPPSSPPLHRRSASEGLSGALGGPGRRGAGWAWGFWTGGRVGVGWGQFSSLRWERARGTGPPWCSCRGCWRRRGGCSGGCWGRPSVAALWNTSAVYTYKQTVRQCSVLSTPSALPLTLLQDHCYTCGFQLQTHGSSGDTDLEHTLKTVSFFEKP